LIFSVTIEWHCVDGLVTTVLLAGGKMVDYVVTFVLEEASLKTGMDPVPETWRVKSYYIRWKIL
jgi:hypothetical protein